MINYNNE
jgi:ribosomal protein S6